jgi:hypothetical protein
MISTETPVIRAAKLASQELNEIEHRELMWVIRDIARKCHHGTEWLAEFPAVKIKVDRFIEGSKSWQFN